MWITNSSRCVLEWKLDSGLGIPDSLSVEIGFHIPIVTGITDSWVEFRIPKPRISDSTNKDFPDSGIWIDNLTEAVIPTNNTGLKQRRRRRQRERQKGNMFRSAKQQLCTYITRFFAFLCCRCTTTTRLRVVPHFSSGIVERAKRERAWKSPHARKGDTRLLSLRKNGGLLVV